MSSSQAACFSVGAMWYRLSLFSRLSMNSISRVDSGMPDLRIFSTDESARSTSGGCRSCTWTIRIIDAGLSTCNQSRPEVRTISVAFLAAASASPSIGEDRRRSTFARRSTSSVVTARNSLVRHPHVLLPSSYSPRFERCDRGRLGWQAGRPHFIVRRKVSFVNIDAFDKPSRRSRW